MSPRDVPASPAEPQPQPEGAAAEAIRDAEMSLAHQGSVTAQIDLHVVSAVLSAHAAQTEGAAKLDALQREIEAAVSTRTDLDTPAGARSFQQYLIDRLRDIRDVVETAGLDATSKAGLAAAMASLYASYGQEAADTVSPSDVTRTQQNSSPPPVTPVAETPPATPEPGGENPPQTAPDVPLLSDPMPLPPMELPAETPAAAPAPAPAPTPAPMPPAIPALGGGVPSSGMPLGGAFPPLSLPPLTTPAANPATAEDPLAAPATARHPEADPTAAEDPAAPADEQGADSAPTGHPGVDTDPELAQVITAAVGGTPIQDAFAEHGIDIPPPGSPVTAPVDPAQVVAGDVGVFADRHALALGNGKALLDDQIQPIASVNRPGFLGWNHPLVGSAAPSTPPESPAPNRPADTAE